MVSCLIQTSPDHRLLPATRSLSQVTTSFIGPSAKASTCVLLLSYSLSLLWNLLIGKAAAYRFARINSNISICPLHFRDDAARTVRATIAMQFSKNRHCTRSRPEPGCPDATLAREGFAAREARDPVLSKLNSAGRINPTAPSCDGE